MFSKPLSAAYGVGTNLFKAPQAFLIHKHTIVAPVLPQAEGRESPLAAYPLLKAYYQRIRELPQLAGYFAGDAYKLAVNNKMAQFK